MSDLIDKLNALEHQGVLEREQLVINHLNSMGLGVTPELKLDTEPKKVVNIEMQRLQNRVTTLSNELNTANGTIAKLQAQLDALKGKG